MSAAWSSSDSLRQLMADASVKAPPKPANSWCCVPRSTEMTAGGIGPASPALRRVKGGLSWSKVSVSPARAVCVHSTFIAAAGGASAARSTASRGAMIAMIGIRARPIYFWEKSALLNFLGLDARGRHAASRPDTGAPRAPGRTASAHNSRGARAAAQPAGDRRLWQVRSSGLDPPAAHLPIEAARLVSATTARGATRRFAPPSRRRCIPTHPHPPNARAEGGLHQSPI
eukprot:scaffold5009_cov103-Isochrysis_galbana.AAC.5